LGISLAKIHQTVEARGRISRIQSKPNEGYTVEIQLPKQPKPPIREELFDLKQEYNGMDFSSRFKMSVRILIACCAFFTGCVQKNYRYGITNPDLLAKLPHTPNLITYGGDHSRIDFIERAVYYPRNLIRSWFPSSKPQADPETLRLKTVQSAIDYLDDNGLQGVYVDVREYNPREQWNRLRGNTRIAPLWKYTGGTLHHVSYCLLPGRAFGRDSYNGFTNTLSVNSTSPANSVLHAGYVKKLYNQRYPGLYMAANWLPIVPLVRDCSVSSDVLTYARVKGDWSLERELLPKAYGKVGSETVSQATSLIPGLAYLPFYSTAVLRAAGKVAGKATGSIVASQREE
jgi:hypothetical protein